VEGERRSERFGQPALPSVVSRTYLIWSLAECGEFADGIVRGDEVIQIAESVGHPYSRILAYFAVGGLYLRKGELVKAVPALEDGLALCQGGNFPLLFPTVASYLGYAHALDGRMVEALPLLEQAVEQGASMRFMFGHSLRVGWLAEAYLLAGRSEDANPLAERALALSREHKERPHEAWTLRLLAEIAAHPDPPDVETAQDHYQAALALATELGMRPLIVHCHFGLGQLYRRTGRRHQAHEHVTTALAMYREMDMRFWLGRAEAEMRELA
jgi:tetratricopeptide (TPR) repeat protein